MLPVPVIWDNLGMSEDMLDDVVVRFGELDLYKQSSCVFR